MRPTVIVLLLLLLLCACEDTIQKEEAKKDSVVVAEMGEIAAAKMYETVNPAYREKPFPEYGQHELNDAEYFQWTADTIDNISCAVYLKGVETPAFESKGMPDIAAVLNEMDTNYILVHVNGKAISINGKVPEEQFIF